MDLEYNSYVEGYHGTCKENYQDIIQSGFKYNKREDHWLGQGIYLYNDFRLSEWWIKTKNKSTRQSNCTPLVLKVRTKTAVRLLDLDRNDHLDYFYSEFRKVLLELGQGIKLEQKEKIKNQCFALDIIKKSHQIDVIRRTFNKRNPSYSVQIEGKSKMLNLFDLSYQETQICLTNNDIIENIKGMQLSENEYKESNEVIELKKR